MPAGEADVGNRVMSSTPRKNADDRSAPPRSDRPPMTQAAMAWSSDRTLPRLHAADAAVARMPATAAMPPAIAKQSV